MSKDEKLLIQKAREGDASAMKALYDSCFKSLFKFVKYKVDRDELAEDITAEAFTRAFENIKKFKGKSSFKTYVYTIAKNLVYGQYKEQSQKVSLDEERQGDQLQNSNYELQDDGMENSEGVVRKESEVSQEVKEILSGLNTKERGVIELRYLSEFSVRETAESLGMSQSNVKVITHRALNKLKKVV